MVALVLAWGCASIHSLGRVERPAAVVVVERHFRHGQYAGDVDVVAQLVSQSGLPLWNGNPGGANTVSMPVATSEFAEQDPVALSDGHGGTFVVYAATSHTGPLAGHSGLWAQHLDPFGRPTWGEGYRSIEVGFNPDFVARNPVLVRDGRGGLLVVYEAEFTEGEHAGDVDIMAQRIARFGTPLWGRGVLVASSRMVERAPVAVSDGRGGALIVYEAEARDGEYAGDSEILAQRIDRWGRLKFFEGTRSLVVSAGRVRERSPVAVSDGRGGVIALFEQHVVDGPYAGRVWVAGQRVSRRGRVLWNAGERSTAVSLGPYAHGGLQAVSDGRGGALAVFEGKLADTEEGASSEVFAQRIDATGLLRFGGGGQAVLVASSDLEDRSPRVVSDGRGGGIVVFEQGAAGAVTGDLSAQRLDANGRLIWGDSGSHSVTVARDVVLAQSVAVTPDGTGGVLVFYEDPLSEVTILEHGVIRGQRLDAGGRSIWFGGERSTVVSGSLASEESPVVAQP